MFLCGYIYISIHWWGAGEGAGGPEGYSCFYLQSKEGRHWGEVIGAEKAML